MQETIATRKHNILLKARRTCAYSDPRVSTCPEPLADHVDPQTHTLYCVFETTPHRGESR